MHTGRTFVLLGALALSVGALASAAHADDWRHAPRSRARAVRHVACNTQGTCKVGGGRTVATRRDSHTHCRTTYRSHRGRAYRSSWARMRRYLPSGDLVAPRARVRAYFLRRYPFAQGDPAAEDQPGDVAALLAIGNEDQGSERALDTLGHLDRGMGRFHVADYDGARKDFEAVLAAKPKEQRARWGLLLTALCTSDLPGAAVRLDRLAKAGEIQRDDRLEGGDCFANPDTFASLVAGLRSHASYRITDGDAHVLTAWSLAVTGKRAEAGRYLRLAKRWGSHDAAVAALEKALTPAARTAAPPPAREAAPVAKR